MSKKIIYLLLAVSIGLNVGVIATTVLHQVGNPPPGPGPRARGRPPARATPRPRTRFWTTTCAGMTRHLDLDAGQQEAIRAVLEVQMPRLVEARAAAEAANRRLVEVFGAPDFDPDAFRRLAAEASASRARVDSLSAVMLVAEAALLTPEQRLKFAAVAPTIHSSPQNPPRRDGPPPR